MSHPPWICVTLHYSLECNPYEKCVLLQQPLKSVKPSSNNRKVTCIHEKSLFCTREHWVLGCGGHSWIPKTDGVTGLRTRKGTHPEPGPPGSPAPACFPLLWVPWSLLAPWHWPGLHTNNTAAGDVGGTVVGAGDGGWEDIHVKLSVGGDTHCVIESAIWWPIAMLWSVCTDEFS